MAMHMITNTILKVSDSHKEAGIQDGEPTRGNLLQEFVHELRGREVINHRNEFLLADEELGGFFIGMLLWIRLRYNKCWLMYLNLEPR